MTIIINSTNFSHFIITRSCIGISHHGKKEKGAWIDKYVCMSVIEYFKFMGKIAFKHHTFFKTPSFNFRTELLAASAVLKKDNTWSITVDIDNITDYVSPIFESFVEGTSYSASRFTRSIPTNLKSKKLINFIKNIDNKKIVTDVKDDIDEFIFTVSLQGVQNMKNNSFSDCLYFIQNKVKDGIYIDIDFVEEYLDKNQCYIATDFCISEKIDAEYDKEDLVKRLLEIVIELDGKDLIKQMLNDKTIN